MKFHVWKAVHDCKLEVMFTLLDEIEEAKLL